MTAADSLLVVRDLTIEYPKRGIGGRGLRAVDGVSLKIRRGETFGLVGESGCGKSSLGRGVLRLEEPTEGAVIFDGTDLGRLGREELRKRRQRMQMVFQDSFASLNPYMPVADIIAEPLDVFAIGTRASRRERAADLLRAVGLDASVGRRFPHEFSGGQRQRINIARALALRPDFIVCDEPVSSLDTTVQAQILDLLVALQDDLGLTLLFISHDLAVVRDLSHRLAIMYLGKLCETGSSEAIYEAPLHPYTMALISAVPIPDPLVEARREGERVALTGEAPSAARPPAGCRFATRCPRAAEVARDLAIDCATTPPLLAQALPGHAVACHLYPTSRPN